MKKIIISIGVASIAALSLTACGSTTKTTTVVERVASTPAQQDTTPQQQDTTPKVNHPKPHPKPKPKPKVIVKKVVVVEKVKPVAQPHPKPKPVTPSVIGKRLDVAEDLLDNAGLNYHEVGGGTFGIVVKSNWGVCSVNHDGGSLGLVVGHFECGGDS